MKNLNRYNEIQLNFMILGMLAYEDFNDGIDDNYALTFKVSDKGDFFKVDYSWSLGCVSGSHISGDPTLVKDDKDVLENNHFKVFKNESLRKFTKEVFDAVNEVKKLPYQLEYTY